MWLKHLRFRYYDRAAVSDNKYLISYLKKKEIEKLKWFSYLKCEKTEKCA